MPPSVHIVMLMFAKDTTAINEGLLVAAITTFKAHLKTELFAADSTRSNISSAASTSDSNSQRAALPINVFDI